MLGAAIGASEEVVLAAERQRANGPLDNVVVDLNAPIVEEARDPVPSAQDVADRLGQFALAAGGGKLGAQTGLERLDDRPALQVTCRKARLGIQAADLVLDRVEGLDALQSF